jgi:hypothetical protein
VLAFGAACCMRRSLIGILVPSYRRATGSVVQIVFLRGRVVIANERSDLFG